VALLALAARPFQDSDSRPKRKEKKKKEKEKTDALLECIRYYQNGADSHGVDKSGINHKHDQVSATRSAASNSIDSRERLRLSRTLIRLSS
jgi:hypothetical protein